MTDIPPDAVLPCGCIARCSIEDGVKTLTYIPCHRTCPNYRMAMGEAASKGLSIDHRAAP